MRNNFRFNAEQSDDTYVIKQHIWTMYRLFAEVYNYKPHEENVFAKIIIFSLFPDIKSVSRTIK